MDNALAFARFYDLEGIQLLEDASLRAAKIIENMFKTESRSWRARKGYRKWGSHLATPVSTDLTEVDTLLWKRQNQELLAGANGSIYREVDGEFKEIFGTLDTGTCAVTNGSATVTGSGTSWSDEDVGKDISFGVTEAGTVATTADSETVTGTGTAFDETWIGRKITISAEVHIIKTVASATSLTLHDTFSRNLSGESYTIEDDKLYRVESVASSTSLTLSEDFAGVTDGSAGYTLGFSLFTPSTKRYDSSEWKGQLYLSNGVDKNIRYDGDAVKKWGVDAPDIRPTVAVTTYETGTVSATNGSSNVTGSGTSWDERFEQRRITIDGVDYVVDTVTSATTLTLTQNYAGGTNSGLSYEIEEPGPLVGRYFYRVTFVNSKGQESNPSDPSFNVDVYNGRNTLKLPTAEPGSDVIARKIYRTFSQGIPEEPRVVREPGSFGKDFDPKIGKRDPNLEPYPDTTKIGDQTKPDYETKTGALTSFTGASYEPVSSYVGDLIDPAEGTQAGTGTKVSAITEDPSPGPDDVVQERYQRTVVVIAPPPNLEYNLVGVVTDGHTVTYEDRSDDASLGLSVEYNNYPPPVFNGSMIFKSRIWGWTDDRVYYSKPGRPEAYPLANYLGLPPDGSKIQACIKMHGSVVVFRDDDIWQTSGADKPLKKATDIGTISPESVIEADGRLYFMAKDGIRQFNGMSSRRMVENLEEITSKSSWEKAQATHDPDRGHVMWSVSSPGTTAQDRILVYSYRTDTWSIYTITTRCLLYSSDIGVLLHGDDYVFIHNAADDDGTAITWKWKSTRMLPVEHGATRLESMVLMCKDLKRTSVDVLVRKDYEEKSITRKLVLARGAKGIWGKSKWGRFNWSDQSYQRRRLDLASTGHRHQVEITGTISDFEMYGFELGFRGLGIWDVA